MRYLWLPILFAFACSSDPEPTPDAGTNTPADATTNADASSAEDATSEADANAIEDAASEADATPSDAATPEDAGVFPAELTLGAPARPATMKIPADYAGEPLPLVILLHGYTVDAATQDFYFSLSPRVDERRFFLVLPDGTQEASAQMSRFWNATDACCNFYGSTVDDVSYLTSLIDEAAQSVTLGRVYLVGHSNGGFMSYRMACDRADRIDAIVSLAGATFADEAQCNPARPISVLQIHGTADTTILYDGVTTGPMRYPGAKETVERWATRAGCASGMITTAPSINLDSALPGDETEVEFYREGCAPSIDVALWTIQNGSHIPALTPDFGTRVLDWLFAH